jgi:hypothetical protein
MTDFLGVCIICRRWHDMSALMHHLILFKSGKEHGRKHGKLIVSTLI